jgi:hypothetical protein
MNDAFTGEVAYVLESDGVSADGLRRYVKIPTPQPIDIPRSIAPKLKDAHWKRYCHGPTSARVRRANIMTKALTAPIAINAVQYISRSKFLGLPFHAAYATAAAIDGAPPNRISNSNPSISQFGLECIVVEEDSLRISAYQQKIEDSPKCLINAAIGKVK